MPLPRSGERLVALFAAGLLAIAGVLVVAAVTPLADSEVPAWPVPAQHLSAWTLALGFAVAARLGLQLRSERAGGLTVTLGQYPLVFGLAFTGGVPYLLAHVGGAAVAGLMERRQPWSQRLLCLAVACLEAAGALTLHLLLVGDAPADGARSVAGTLAVVAALDVLRGRAMTAAASLRRGERVHPPLRQVGWRFTASLANGSVALVGVVLALRAPAALLLLGVVAVVLFGAHRANVRALNRLAVETGARERAGAHDLLTGLLNRSGLAAAADAAVLEQGGAGLLLVDLDGFSRVNEAFGREVGDEVLRETGRRLATLGGTVARSGGDEFVVLLPGRLDGATVTVAARTTTTMLSRPYAVEGLRLSLAARIGSSVAPQDALRGEDLLQRADIALHQAKSAGSVHVSWTPEAATDTADRLALMSELGDALEDGGLDVWFQPTVDVASQRVVGAEALVRWLHPVRGFVPPDVFVPLAEGTDLMRSLTRFVLRTSLTRLAGWRAQGLLSSVSVNLSARELVDTALPAEVEALLAETGVPASALTLEITETAVIDEPLRAARVLRDLDALGVTLALDDFGTGYSPLTYLQSLPVSQVKVDRSFVLQLAERGDNQAIVRALVALSHDLGKTVVAEGVEDVEALALLRAWGCDRAQGYLFARPLRPDDVPGWLRAYAAEADGDVAAVRQLAAR